MRLKELEIQGFKSFPDKTKIEIGEGITGVVGPCPPDSVFSQAIGGWYDIVVCMYHDQGHIPLKTVGFVYDREKQEWKAVEGVNVTLGLPIIRASVDHGTDFYHAGKGNGNELSLDFSVVENEGAKVLAVASLIGGVDMVDPTIKVINPVTSEESELPFVEVFKESELH